VEFIGDVQVAKGIEGDCNRLDQTGGRGLSAIAKGGNGLSSAREARDQTRLMVDSHDVIVKRIADEQVARRVQLAGPWDLLNRWR